MKLPGRYALAVLLAAPILACSGPTEPDHQSFYYPLAMGNQWVYDYMETRTYDDGTPPDTIRYTITASVVPARVAVVGEITHTILEDAISADGDTLKGSTTYYNELDGMYALAHSEPGPGLALPKAPPGISERLTDERLTWTSRPSVLLPAAFSSAHDVIYDPPRRVFAYPQTVGYRWNVIDPEAEDGLALDKEFTGWERVTVPAGTFDCVAVKWYHLNLIGMVNVESRVASVGLVSRTIWMPDVAITDYSGPGEPVRRADVEITYTLRSYCMKPEPAN